MADSNKFKLFSGIRSFSKLDGGYVIVTDVETKVSVTEDAAGVYNMLKLLLKEEQFAVFEREYTAGTSVMYDFNKGKLYFVRSKEKGDLLSSEMSMAVIENRLNDEDEKDKYFL